MIIPSDLGLQMVGADVEAQTTSQVGRRCVYTNGGTLYFRAGDSEDTDTGSWRDGGDHNFHLEMAYLDIGTDAIQVGYSNDGTTETLETVVTKTGSGDWKLVGYNLALTAKTAHTVYQDYGLADFCLVTAGENYISLVVLIDRDYRSDVMWTLDQYRALVVGMLGGYFEGVVTIGPNGGIFMDVGGGSWATPQEALKMFDNGGVVQWQSWSGGVLQLTLGRLLQAAFDAGIPLVQIGYNGIELMGSRSGVQTYTAGPSSLGTATEVAHGTLGAWNSISDARVENAQTAYIDNATSGTTKVTRYIKRIGFGFNIPAAATITRVKVEILRAGATAYGYVVDETVRLLKAGALDGDNKADTVTHYPSANTTAFPTVTGSTWAVYDFDLNAGGWNIALAPADVNAATFGVDFAASITMTDPSSSAYCYVDCIRMSITYTLNAAVSPFQAHGNTLQGLGDGVNNDDAATVGQAGISAILTPSDFVNTSGAFTDVTGLGFAIAANETWVFDFHLITNQSGTGALRVAINGPAGATLNATDFGTTADASTYTSGRLTTLGAGSISFMTVSGFDGFITIRGSIVNGANAGTVQLQAKRQSANGNARIYVGSTMVAKKV